MHFVFESLCGVVHRSPLHRQASFFKSGSCHLVSFVNSNSRGTFSVVVGQIFDLWNAFILCLLNVVQMVTYDSSLDKATFSIQITLLAIVFILAIIGNGVVCFAVARFRRLRTIPNFFIVNLSVIDLCDALINMPLFAGYYIAKASFFQGKWLWVVCFSLDRVVKCLRLLTFLAIMLDRLGAIRYHLRYHTWKTKRKAFCAIALIWVTATVLALGMGFRGKRILSHEGLTVLEYHRILFKTESWKFVLCSIVFPFLALVILGILVYCTVRSSMWRVEAADDRDGGSQRRRRALFKARNIREVKTARSIAVVIVAYFICYFPAFLSCILVKNEIYSPWAEYFAFFFAFLSGAFNPMVYFLRSRYFRESFKGLLKCKGKNERVHPCRSQGVDQQ